jgi:hypothetical protein
MLSPPTTNRHEYPPIHFRVKRGENPRTSISEVMAYPESHYSSL